MFFLSNNNKENTEPNVQEQVNEDFEQIVSNGSTQTDIKKVNDNSTQSIPETVNSESQTDIPEVVKNNNESINYTKYMEDEFMKFTKDCDNKFKEIDDMLFSLSNQFQSFLDKQFNK